MAKWVTCDNCGRDNFCKPASLDTNGKRTWLCEDCYEFEDYVKPKESKRIKYQGDDENV